MRKKFIVAGGGTAGWLTALTVECLVDDVEVILIESEEIGILGAGEGTVPNIVQLLVLLGISFEDIIKNADGTVKLGINFVNWNGDDSFYTHTFGDPESKFTQISRGLFYRQIANSGPVQEISFGYHLILNKKSNFIFDESSSRLQTQSPFALHFNARKLAAYLRTIAESRGIKRIEGKISTVQSHPNSDIKSLILDDKTEIEGDFFFDCTGFSRLLIGKHFGSEWYSYKDQLPLDTALPFFIPHQNKNIKPVTEAIAMKYGWVWKIPVKDRYGCGYVFDSSYIDRDSAIKELEDYFQIPIESPKTFRFNAGCYKEIWKRNCLAVGLSSGFIEPLEATSIWVNNLNLTNFMVNLLYDINDDRVREIYNQQCFCRNEEIKDFIHLHYLGKRKDSEFWKTFQDRHPPSSNLAEKIKISNTVGFNWNDQDIVSLIKPLVQDTLFPTNSWAQVMDGLKLIDKEPYTRLNKIFNIDHQTFLDYATFITKLIDRCLDNDEFLNLLWEKK
jgi:tryptophan halogenase